MRTLSRKYRELFVPDYLSLISLLTYNYKTISSDVEDSSLTLNEGAGKRGCGRDNRPQLRSLIIVLNTSQPSRNVRRLLWPQMRRCYRLGTSTIFCPLLCISRLISVSNSNPLQ